MVTGGCWGNRHSLAVSAAQSWPGGASRSSAKEQRSRPSTAFYGSVQSVYTHFASSGVSWPVRFDLPRSAMDSGCGKYKNGGEPWALTLDLASTGNVLTKADRLRPRASNSA